MIKIKLSNKKLFGRFTGLTIFPFIFFFTDNISKRLINHEKIHIIQQLECLIIPFYVIYAINYLINYYLYSDSRIAYRNIIFEREAKQNDSNLNYLKERKLFAWLRKK